MVKGILPIGTLGSFIEIQRNSPDLDYYGEGSYSASQS